jgi:glycosyltransferase involved in cell wall biosynthesis
MRILHISSARSFGEQERHLAELCAGLHERGHEVYAALRPTSDWQHRLSFLPPERILQVSIRNSFGVLSARRIGEFVRENEIEIVHAHIPRDYIPASIACSMVKRSRFVLTRHSSVPLRPFNRFALKNLSRAIAVTSDTEAGLRRLFPPAKVSAIHNGVSLERLAAINVAELRERFRSSHGIPSDALVVGMAGEISELSGQRDLVLAALEVIKDFSQTRFVIVGRDGSPGKRFRRELRRLASAFDADENFIWLDRAEESDFLASIDIYVSPTHTETSGLIILEAMSFGRPVIAAETPGTAELIGHDSLLVKRGDIIDLAEHIKALIGDDALRSQTGEAARLRAINKYPLEHMISKTEELYRSLT